MIHDDRLEGKLVFLTGDNDQIDPIDRRIDGYSFRELKCEHWCSRDKFSLIDRRNLTFNHFVHAKSSLEEIRSERFKKGRVYMGRLSKILQECLQKSKNALFYRRIGRNRWMDAFNLHQRSGLNASR